MEDLTEEPHDQKNKNNKIPKRIWLSEEKEKERRRRR